jgi:hypothetical protein
MGIFLFIDVPALHWLFTPTAPTAAGAIPR